MTEWTTAHSALVQLKENLIMSKRIPKFKTVTAEELYPDHGYGPVHDLYVYSVVNNPEGAGRGTLAEFVGTVEHYSEAADIESIVEKAAAVLGGDVLPAGLCIVESWDD